MEQYSYSKYKIKNIHNPILKEKEESVPTRFHTLFIHSLYSYLIDFIRFYFCKNKIEKRDLEYFIFRIINNSYEERIRFLVDR